MKKLVLVSMMGVMLAASSVAAVAEVGDPVRNAKGAAKSLFVIVVTKQCQSLTAAKVVAKLFHKTCSSDTVSCEAALKEVCTTNNGKWIAPTDESAPVCELP